MQEVLKKAQELGLAILDSEIYKHSKELEERMMADPEASRLLSAYMEAQRQVNELLADDEMEPAVLAEAGDALEKAREALNANDLIRETQEANQAANTMIENVNRIIQLIVTGSTGEGGCTGDCGSCGGCH